jgi:nucleotide-binding universal stress UspA family protein
MNAMNHNRSPVGITTGGTSGTPGYGAGRRGRKVLFPTDYSQASRHAFELACRLAQGGAGLLTLVHAADPPRAPLGMAAGPSLPAGYRGAWESRLSMVRPADHAVRFEYRVEEGDPADAVLRAAGETGSDLIVMGARRRTALGRLLYRGVTDSVARRAPCPVLTLTPAPDGAAGQSGDLPLAGGLLGHGTILHPTDFSGSALYALGVARDLARASGCRLLVIHVAPVRLYREPGHRRELEEALRRLAAASPGVRASGLLLAGDPAAEIVSTVTQLDCGLIVMGTSGRTGLDRWLRGSLAGAVRGSARCPVLTVRLPDRGRWALPDRAAGQENTRGRQTDKGKSDAAAIKSPAGRGGPDRTPRGSGPASVERAAPGVLVRGD